MEMSNSYENLNDKQLSGQTIKRPKVGIAIGSKSDWPIMCHAVNVLRYFNIDYDIDIVSAHRTPDFMLEYAYKTYGKYQVIIAGAGGAAHLPGMLASKTRVPVLAVPINEMASKNIAEMPEGIPIATFGVGWAGATNAAIFAVQMLAMNDSNIDTLVQNFRREQTERVLNEKIVEE